MVFGYDYASYIPIKCLSEIATNTIIVLIFKIIRFISLL